MKVFRKVFIILEVILYVSFMSLDATDKAHLTSAWIKYCGIVLCLGYVLLSVIFQFFNRYRNESPQQRKESLDQYAIWSRDSLLLMIGLFFTVLSDYNLLITDRYTLGLFFFCIVQTTYLIRIAFHSAIILVDWIPLTRSLILRRFIGNAIMILVVLTILTICKVQIELLLILTSFYFTHLVMNVVFAFRNRRLSRGTRIFAYGLILFLCCDINVGIFNLSDFIAIDGNIYSVLYRLSTLGMWFFYLPSQVLIALSCDRMHSDIAIKR